jgi:hypothetical protein
MYHGREYSGDGICTRTFTYVLIRHLPTYGILTNIVAGY